MKPKKPDFVPPPAPADLSERAREIWQSSVAGNDVLSSTRLALLRECLLSLDRAEECRRLLAEQGLATITKGTGAVHVNPLAKLEKEHRALYAKLLGQLCLRFH